ncbi:MAG: hypothetical protein AB1627_10360 [Chloroflexota bacterium]
MTWLLRLAFLRLLGPRALPILALLGLIRTLRSKRPVTDRARRQA